jgi:hypothetical protein
MRCGYHDDGGMATPLAVPQVLKDFDAPFLRKVYIENHHDGTWGGIVLVGFIEESRRLVAILGDMNLGSDPSGFDRFLNQENVRRVILDDEDMRVIDLRLRLLGG